MLRLGSDGGTTEPAEADLTETNDQYVPDDPEMYEVMMSFEEFGGALFGCEFGGVQRAFGAKPLGLLRWADLAPENIISVLEQRFEGVGLPENTEIFIYETGEGGEYGTRDKRFHMAMHTFVQADSAPADKVFHDACRRLRYLSRKLMGDIESGGKIFVYKLTYDSLTAAQLGRLHSAVRSYGPTTLLYVRYSDQDHPDGSVEVVAPGLLVGYLDRFGVSRDGKGLPLPINSWAAVCRQAREIWRSGASEGTWDPPISPDFARMVSPSEEVGTLQVQWGGQSTEHLRREAVASATDDLQERLRSILADTAGGSVVGSRDDLERIARDFPNHYPNDPWFFENYLLACMTAGAFDLAGQIIHDRFDAPWRCEITLAASEEPVYVVRWEAVNRKHSRFVFNPDMFCDDNAVGTILFWIRTLALYDGFHRSRQFADGVVHVSLWDAGLVPGISFSDNDPSRLLAPDPMFLHTEGYRQLRADLDSECVPWGERIPCALWRGATTGAWDNKDWGTLPRIRLCRIAAAGGDRIDAGINSIVQMSPAVESEISSVRAYPSVRHAAGFRVPQIPDRYRWQHQFVAGPVSQAIFRKPGTQGSVASGLPAMVL